jgi:hypothetical protein
MAFWLYFEANDGYPKHKLGISVLKKERKKERKRK